MVLPTTSLQGLWEKCERGIRTLNPNAQWEKGLWSSSGAYKNPFTRTRHAHSSLLILSSFSFFSLHRTSALRISSAFVSDRAVSKLWIKGSSASSLFTCFLF